MKLYNIASSIDMGYWTESYDDALNQFKKEIINFEENKIYPDVDFVALIVFDMDDFYSFDFNNDYLDFMKNEAEVINQCTWEVDEKNILGRALDEDIELIGVQE